MRRTGVLLLLLALLLLLCGCSGGQEIEDCLFVISMGIDPAPDGSLTVTVKALSGTQEDAAPQERTSAQSSGQSGGQSGQSGQGGAAPDGQNAENTERGYVVMSATAGSCLRALSLLSATTPRTVNLSQLQEVVISQTLAQTDATLSILREIYSLFEANGEAVVVVTPDNAGDFIRRQYAMFGVRLSQYLQVLFEHFERLGTIPPHANLASVISAMESGASDAAAVYAAANDFSATLALDTVSETDRLPGHLPRTSPARNEYLGSAVFSGSRMTGTLTGQETATLRLLSGEAVSTSFVLEDAMMQVGRRTRARRTLAQEGGETVLGVRISMDLQVSAGVLDRTDAQIAAQLEESAVQLLRKLQAAGCDALGFGHLAAMRHTDIPSWEASGWEERYQKAQVQAKAEVRIR